MNSVHDLLAEGFPHSDIRGSTIARISPRLFAACHVLHRLLAPRHPPNALITLENTSNTARAQDQTAHDHHWPPPAWTLRAVGAGTTLPQPTYTHIRTNHPTPSPHRWSHMGGQSIRQIRFTVSKNMPAPGRNPGRNIAREVRDFANQRITRLASGG